MADKVFGQDFVDITSPTGAETISVLQSGTMKDVSLTNVVSGVTHNATGKSTPVDADELPISDSAASNALKKLAWSDLKTTLVNSWGVLVAALTSKATPVDADAMLIADSAATNASKKLTWANLKATLLSSFGAMINSLTGKTTPVDADELVIGDSAASNATKKLTWANVKATLISSFGVMVNGLTGKTTPVDADELVIGDSAASNATKKLTWSNVKATLKTYFDTLYSAEWNSVSDSWSYASASTITVPTDATTIYQVGDRLRFKQGGGYKYYTIAAVAATTITVDVNTDYTVANAAITNIAYSRAPVPYGFPAYFNWSPTASGHTVGNGTVTARFSRTGKWIDFMYSFTLGSTSSISGDFSITLPVTPSPDFTAFADLSDTGTAGYVAFAVGANSTGQLYIRAVNVAGTYPTNSTTFSATVPFTWTTSDAVRAGGRYLTA